MTSQYFKIIARDLIRRKSFSLINIAGIALGFAVCILTVLYVYTEFSFDRHIPGVANKYRIIYAIQKEQAVLPYVFLEKLEPQLPEGSQICLTTSEDPQFFSYNQSDYKFEHILASDSRFVSMFGISLIQGDTTKILDAPLQIILSEHAARKMFGTQNPVNKTIKYRMKNFTVTGVFRDLPASSHQWADLVFSIPSYKDFGSSNVYSDWAITNFNYYLSLPPNTNIGELRDKIKTIFLELNPNYRNSSAVEKSAIKFELEPVTDIHLKSGHMLWDDDKNKGSISMVVAFLVISMLILIMAAFNYINLSTAYFQTKNKFSGIQKVLGANACNLIQYILMQTSVMVAGGFLLSLILVKLLLPYFNMVVARQIPFSLLLVPPITGTVCLIIGIMIVLSGFYPAISFSRENPVFALKGKVLHSNSGLSVSLRKLLVIAQFVISIALVSSILVVGKQVRMMTTQKLGFNAEQLLEVDFQKDKENYDLFKSRLDALPGIAGITTTDNTPAEIVHNDCPFRLSRETDDKNRSGSGVVEIDPNYFDVMHIRLLEGEPFTPSIENLNVAILSKTAVEKLGLSKSLGERVHLSFGQRDCIIVGVVDDVQYHSLRDTPKAVVYLPNHNNYSRLIVRLGKGNHVETMAAIKKVWHSILPDVPFNFKFFDSKIQDNYAYENSVMRLLNILVVISLLIASLGIFGLIMEVTVQRKKEIGIRKVNGATISEVMALLNKDFVRWVAIAFVIATPIAWYAMNKWLENFAYKTNLSWWIFALAGLLALGIALLTVSWQSWRAATRNPVEALRYE